jgi:hypothetical protein
MCSTDDLGTCATALGWEFGAVDARLLGERAKRRLICAER